MRYYCKSCRSTIDVTEIELWNGEPLNPKCPFCIDMETMPIPKYETVAQWEARRGRKYPDNAPVYTLKKYEPDLGWFLKSYSGKSEVHYIIVATEASPPPDDWRPA